MGALHDVGELCVTRRQLLQRAVTVRAIAAAVHRGDILRVRRGWYALPSIDTATERAVRIGGRVGCVSAARHFGIWVGPHIGFHVALRHEASRLRDPLDKTAALDPDDRRGCVLHWSSSMRGGSATHVSVKDSLAQLVRCQPVDLAIAAVDSALNLGLITLSDLDQLGIDRAVRSRVNGLCESGLESIARLLAEDLGFQVRPQVLIEGVGRVDLLVNGRVIIETDGRLGHDDPVSQARDYSRDAALAALGYIVLRFNYRQVMQQRWVVQAAIRGAVAAHRGA